MIYMKDIKFNAKDLCSIIDSCGLNNVKCLELDGIKIDFSHKKENIIAENNIIIKNVDNEKDLIKEELKIKEDQLELMAIEDPLKFEEYILSGELNTSGENNVSINESGFESTI